MYSEKTISKFKRIIRELIKYYDGIPLEELTVSISMGNKKVPCANVSKAPIVTCPNCDACKWECYDVKDCYSHGGWNSSVIHARAKNTSIFRRSIKKYFADIWKFLDGYKGLYFRWHVGGDICTRKEWEYMKETARIFPHITFWTYTKSDKIVNAAADDIPANFKVMSSPWEGMTVENPHGFASFFVDVEPPRGAWICTGDCGICINAKRGCPVGEDVYAKKH